MPVLFYFIVRVRHLCHHSTLHTLKRTHIYITKKFIILEYCIQYHLIAFTILLINLNNIFCGFIINIDLRSDI